MTNGSGLITPEQIIAGRGDWRARLVQEYDPVAERLMKAYERMLDRLQPLADDLTTKLIEMADAGIEITPDDVRGLDQYQRLLARIEIEMAEFAVLVKNDTGLLVDGSITAGAEAARLMTLASAGRVEGVIEAGWIEPNPEVLRQLIGYLDSDAMQEAFKRFERAVITNSQRTGIADVLLSGVAQGKHPTLLARVISDWFQMPYAWAENMTRTVQLWSARMASHTTYAANSHLVEGWMWWSARDGTTCMSCWSQHGTLHTNDEYLNDHHRGRCSPLPVVIGADWPSEVMLGPELFGTLSEDDQRKVLGQALFDLYKQDKLPWEDLSRKYSNPVYGEMLRAATVGEVISGQAAA